VWEEKGRSKKRENVGRRLLLKMPSVMEYKDV